MDYYLNNKYVIERLLQEYHQYNKLIIAYDFDNTVYDYHQKGYTFNQVIDLLRECHNLGFYLIVFTCCEESKYSELKAYLQINDIPFDAINESPEYIPFKGRKIYYNLLLDDRAGLSSAFEALKEVIKVIKKKE